MAYLPKIDFSESKPDEHLEAIRQEYEPFLTKLEALFVQAIASNDWTAFYAHVVDFQNEHDLHGETGIAIGDAHPSHLGKYFPKCKDKAEASTKDLTRPGADFSPKSTQ